MSSGYGVGGGVGRCYPFWVEFAKCMVNVEDRTDCWEFREDYLECLHHRKEIARNTEIYMEKKKQEAEKKLLEEQAAAAAAAASKKKH
mmetsp:Transcript_4864/g.8940  ORF Transcript_4864/g.8940 Transcript_4864/m.8940 type:complete len:88 (-) Transcript_4864:173-436(-)|eukprot:CAMPEP_0184691926 /NCGR_PEP_ID=MMETSP0313-20130426/615_1 /TAXON_ID=2792 /ORGANISM="Porphyridium aerugineum, Strain SAG 1380-2" /LENGTH=87 /DNA_ID=CAMNT_0027149709 /DNA_START=160 /DNA_END=423 /DNA_ORIENTATION=+